MGTRSSNRRLGRRRPFAIEQTWVSQNFAGKLQSAKSQTDRMPRRIFASWHRPQTILKPPSVFQMTVATAGLSPRPCSPMAPHSQSEIHPVGGCARIGGSSGRSTLAKKEIWDEYYRTPLRSRVAIHRRLLLNREEQAASPQNRVPLLSPSFADECRPGRLILPNAKARRLLERENYPPDCPPHERTLGT